MAAAFHAARCASKAVRGRGVLLCCKKTLSLVGELTLESPKCGLVNGLRAFSIGSNLKHELKFTKEHEWVKVADGVGTVGITDYAQAQLGDVVYVELPEVGTDLSQGDGFGALESVKAASDLYAPVSGEIVETNEALEGQPSLINTSPYDDGWIAKIKLNNPDELKSLLNKEDYDKFVEEEEA